jgi:glycosyltransferase involved in cell wall biosynthesis
MKILHILNELRPSGAEIMLTAASTHFHAQGIDTSVVATGASAGPFADTLAHHGYRILHVPTGSGLAGLHALYRTLKDLRPEVVHVHAERLSYWVCLVALAAGCRVVRTFHAVFRFDGLLRLRRRWQRRHLESLGVVSVAISPSVQHNEQQRFGISPTVIDNWIDLQRFPPVNPTLRAQARHALGCEAEAFVLLTVGNCSTIKNHAVVLEAMARIGRRIRLQYLHVGLEEPDTPEQQLATALGIRDQVVFVGKTSCVIDYLHACDLFVMPSLHEGFGLAAAEALAAGAHCLFTDVEGLRDFRRDFPGIRYCAPTSESIAHSIEQIHRSIRHGDTPAPATAHLEQARQVFHPRRGVDAYLDLYRGGPCKHT